MEEVTVSTAGLTADGGAQGAVQIQFVTKRGTNRVPRARPSTRSRTRSCNANTPVNNARGIPKPRIRQHEFGFNLGGPIIRNRLFFFGNYEQIHVPGTTVLNRTVLTTEATQGIFRYVGHRWCHPHREPARRSPPPTAFPARSIRSWPGSCS